MSRDLNLLGTLSLAVADRVRGATQSEAQAAGEGPAALVALTTFLERPTIQELSGVLGLTHSATVRLVDKLEARGLIERRPTADRRAVAIVLTPDGRAVGLRVLAARERILGELLAPLSPAERTELTRLHERLLAGLVGAGAQPTRVCRMCEPVACGHEVGLCPVTEAARRRRAQLTSSG